MTYEEVVLETAESVLGDGPDSVLAKNYFEVTAPELYKHIQDYAIQAISNGTNQLEVAESVAAFVYTSIKLTTDIQI